MRANPCRRAHRHMRPHADAPMCKCTLVTSHSPSVCWCMCTTIVFWTVPPFPWAASRKLFWQSFLGTCSQSLGVTQEECEYFLLAPGILFRGVIFFCMIYCIWFPCFLQFRMNSTLYSNALPTVMGGDGGTLILGNVSGTAGLGSKS